MDAPVDLSERPLEAESAAIAQRAKPGRTAQLAARHWGWDGSDGARVDAPEAGLTDEEGPVAKT